MPTWPSIPSYPPNLFAGTARYYIQYRPPYPPDLHDHIRTRSALSGSGVLLDLACGPGRVTLPLAPFFTDVHAVDLEPDIIAAGKDEANRLGLSNIRWTVGRAEDVEQAPGSVELVTIGEAFHRLDQRRVGELAKE